jgi:serine-type D-Ala-D-Ala carboxypeptidase/endopeptidase (penicillin-binding protein 4)
LLTRRARLTVVLAAIVLAVVTASDAEAGLRGRLDRALRSPYVSPSLTGAIALDLTDGSRIYAHKASLSLRPASNEKLVVALAALDRLGPESRIPTAVFGEGTLVDGVLQGRIVLKGYGDPSLSRRDLEQFAANLKAAGITSIAGNVVGDESYYDSMRTAPGWKPSYYKEESPPLSALIVNRGRVGRVTVDNPALAAARAFRRELIAAGIAVPRSAKRGIAGSETTRLGRRFSGELSRLVSRMNLESDNFYAEMLLKQLGARVRGAGTTADGARVARQELKERGAPLEGVRIVDGSGLSSQDRLTARAIVAMLISAWSDPVIKNAFVTSLPVAGVSGTLRERMTTWPAYGRVRAKTGTTSTASALSGYVRTRYVFSVLQNGFPVSVYYARRTQDRFAAVLAGA